MSGYLLITFWLLSCYRHSVVRFRPTSQRLGEVAASLTFLRGSNFQIRTAVSAGLMPLSRQTARCVQCFAIYSFSYLNCYFHSNQFNAFCVMPLYHSSSLFVVFANSFEKLKKRLTCFGCGVYVAL